MAVEKSLDRKLAEIRANYDTRTFVLADAKDPDMAFGMSAPGRSPEYYGDEIHYRSLAEFRQCIRDVVRQGAVDIMLMSASTSEILTIEERLFDNSHVTPAVRTNDTTDIHMVRGANYPRQASRPFRTPTLDHAICAKLECTPEDEARGVNLGLYSVTFSNDAELDRATIEAFKQFRLEAERRKFRYFLEVFDPNVPGTVDPDLLGAFMNDMIARTLAGVTKAAKPLFLKMVYQGPKYMEEIVHYDPDLIPGIMGGAAGTTYDAFKLVAEAQKYGARVALLGRKINNSENQLAFIKMLRLIVDGAISPEEAVRAYHGVLQELRIRPYRSLEDDMEPTDPSLAYLRSPSLASKPVAVAADIIRFESAKVETPPAPPAQAAPSKPAPPDDFPRLPDGSPDFDRMTIDQKIAYNKQERDRVFGW